MAVAFPIPEVAPVIKAIFVIVLYFMLKGNLLLFARIDLIFH